jgi:hypothetical protein
MRLIAILSTKLGRWAQSRKHAGIDVFILDVDIATVAHYEADVKQFTPESKGHVL